MKESFAGRFDESATPGHVEAGQDSPAKTVWRAEEGETIDTEILFLRSGPSTWESDFM